MQCLVFNFKEKTMQNILFGHIYGKDNTIHNLNLVFCQKNSSTEIEKVMEMLAPLPR